MKAKNDKQKDKRISALISAIGHQAPIPDEDFLDKLRERSTAEFLAYSADENKKSEKATTHISIWRIIMKSRVTKLATAAVIIIIVLTSILQFESSGVAWGEVVKKLEEIHAYSFRKRRLETTEPQKEGFKTEIETKVYYSPEHGEWTESYRNGKLSTRTYALLKEKKFFGIVPPAKIYDRRTLSAAEIREMEQMMPRQVVKRFLEADYKTLGGEIIDGVTAEGVEIYDPKVLSPSALPVKNFVARLWVDVETELPVRLELEFVVDGKLYTKMIFDQFQWNIHLDASDFEPDIPADYTLGTHGDG